jgi:hypothetical protein
LTIIAALVALYNKNVLACPFEATTEGPSNHHTCIYAQTQSAVVAKRHTHTGSCSRCLIFRCLIFSPLPGPNPPQVMYTAMWLSCVGVVGFTMCCAMPVALALSSWNQGSGRLYGVCCDGMIKAGRLRGGNSGQIFIRSWACIWSHRFKTKKIKPSSRATSPEFWCR